MENKKHFEHSGKDQLLALPKTVIFQKSVLKIYTKSVYNVFTLTISEYREIAPFLYEVKSCPIRLILETIFRISLNAYLNAFHKIWAKSDSFLLHTKKRLSLAIIENVK